MREASFILAKYDGRDNIAEDGGEMYLRISDRDRVILSAYKGHRDMTRIIVVFADIEHREVHTVLCSAREAAERLGLRQVSAEDAR